MSKKLFLLDAYALIYRSYFAFIKNPRINSKGLNTSAALGMVNTLEQVIREQAPDYLAIAFDLKAPTFRHKMYEAYKANREAMPEDLREIIPYIRKIVEAFNIPILEKEGYEADDIVGTIAKHPGCADLKTYMMTPDKDYAQLVDESTFMFKPKRFGNGTETWGIKEVLNRFDIEKPEQVIDILGLMGDASDNIPGCPGVGEKTAMKLIKEFGSIENIYENIDQLKGKQKENLENNKELVLLSKELVKIITDVPIDVKIEDLTLKDKDLHKITEVYEELEFKSMLSKLGAKKSTPAKGAVIQTSLFDDFSDEPNITDTPDDFANIDNTKHKYTSIETEVQRKKLIAELSAQKAFCIDTETTSLDTMNAEIVCLSFSFKAHEAFMVPIPKDCDKAQEILSEFSHVLQDEKIEKVGQNIKYDINVLKNHNIEIKGKIFDTMIAHYLIEPEMRHNLDALSESYLNYKKIPTSNLLSDKHKTMRNVAKELLLNYACEDADITMQLKSVLEKELKERELMELFRNIEMPLVDVLSTMEINGVHLDKNELADFSKDLQQELITLDTEIKELAGEDFNISSPKQLGIILFEKLKITSKAKKTKTKQYSTSEETLSALKDKHPIVEKILDFRGKKKLLSTYVDALPLLINKKSHRLHTSFNQAVTATGRLSSTNPNLQNIPIRDDEGKRIRKAFSVENNNNVFLSADYSQIELRILAHMCQDQNMIEAFNNNADIHSMTASKIFNTPLDKLSREQRSKAKMVNFGIVYGISAFGLAQRLNISRTEAKNIIDDYFANFPSIQKFIDNQINTAREKGFATTLMGRRRYLRDISSANSVVRSVAERNAINAPIQGAASDIIKLAMVNIHKQMQKQKLKSMMVLQVHDELNFEVPKDELDTMQKIVKTEMENVIKLEIPLTIDMKSGKDWLEAH
ncbi:MAG: DNA polymerase I [Bacteroidales bacterium]